MTADFSGFTATSLLWDLLWYGALMLIVGLIASWLLRRRPARAHAALMLSLVAALIVPLPVELARCIDVGVLAPVPVTRAAPPSVPEVAHALTNYRGDVEHPTLKQRIEDAGGQVLGGYVGRSLASDEFDWQSVIESGWISAAAPLWCLLSVVVVVRTIVAARRARRLVVRAADTVPELVRAAAERAAVEAGVRRAPVVRVSGEVTSPVVWCWGRRPVIVVPAKVEGDVDWTAVMRHELAHWTRRDHLADAFARAAIAIVPLNPLVWMARARLERLAERACDDWAVSRGDGAAYAQSLVTLASRIRGPRLALPVARKGSDLAARVRRVLGRRAAMPRIGRWWLVASVATALGATAALALARHPSGEITWIRWGQDSKPADSKPQEDKQPTTVGLPLDQGVRLLYDTMATGNPGRTFTLASEIEQRKDPSSIPLLIGVIDADNTYSSVYGVGYFGLSRLTGVPYDDRYDGTWWKAWWEKNKSKYPEAAQKTAIPSFPATKNRVAHVYDWGEWVGLTTGEPPERLVKEMERRMISGGHGGLDVSDLAARLTREQGPRAIPLLIGVIDSDNTYSTIYGVGYFGLTPITGVPYDERRDGPWWRAWWEKNKSKYPQDARETPIPTLKKSPNYVASVYDHGQWIGEVGTEPLSRMMDELKRRVESGNRPGAGVSGMAQIIAERNDPASIPGMIALIRADNTDKLKYDIGYFGLRGITKVNWDESHDGEWWAKWWDENRAQFPGVPAAIPAVELKQPPLPKGADPQLADVADVPNEDIALGDKKRYFLIGGGLSPDVPAAAARPLLVILPGGDGSADFNPFIRRIWKNALPKGFVVAQGVAPKWRDDEDRVVWPTEKVPDEKAAFSTEKFIEEIIADAKTRAKIDPARVYILGWSSGGPPAYAMALREGSGIAGAFVAMSIYKPSELPPLTNAKGKSFYLLHSPEDFIKMEFPRKAVADLGAAGARVKLQEYAGGHGWKGNIWQNIRTGVEWLMAKDEKPATPTPTPAPASPKP